jgi:outer membrane protein TolC
MAAAIDPVVASAQAQLQASRERVNQADALLLPNVSATSNLGINAIDNNWTAAPPRRWRPASWRWQGPVTR